MSKKSELNARHYLFLLKAAACFAGLVFGSFLLTPTARMQDGDAGIANRAMVMNGNYRPTPEPPKSTVRGRVYYEDTGRAVKRTSIMLMGKEGRREVSGLTDNNGVFQIKNVPAGTYYAFINAPGVVSPLAFADLSKPRNDGLEEAVESFPPIVVSGVVDVNVEIPARRGGAISGRVMYADGDPAIGVKVEVLRKGKDKYMSVVPGFSAIFSMVGGGGFQTDDRGVYRFAGLPNGEYIVKATENVSHSDSKPRDYSPFGDSLFGASSLLNIFYSDAFDAEKAQKVNVVAGQELSEINIFIPDRDLFSVEGTVINAKDRQPVKNVSISLKKKDDSVVSLFSNFGRRNQTGSSDEQGRWNFKELPKGTYTMTVEPANPYSYDEDEYAGNMNGNRSPKTPPKPKLAKKTQEITIDDKNLSEIVIELGYGATISGTVKTENSEAMPNNVTITAAQEDSDVSSSASVYNYSAGSGVAMAANSSQNLPSKPNYDFKMEGVADGKTFLSAAFSDDNFYVKSAIFNGIDLLINPLELKEGDVLRNVQIIVSKSVGTLKGTIVDENKQPAKNVWVLLVPTDAAKRKNKNFRRGYVTGETGEFEIKAAPLEYAVIVAAKDFDLKKGEEGDRWREEAVKNAAKVTLKPNETEKISLTMPK